MEELKQLGWSFIKKNKVFIALGSNLGNKKQNLEKAIKLISEKCKVVSTSSFIESKPMYFEKQPNFLNAVIQVETSLGAKELLFFLQGLEKKIGRKKRFKYGPREIDLDILFFNNEAINSGSLVVPHPKMNQREFVLQPLNEIAPNFIHPILKKSIKTLLSKLIKN